MKERVKEQVCLYLNMVGEPHKIEICKELIDSMYEGIVHFCFRKVDGTARSAYGTLNLDILYRHQALDNNPSNNSSRGSRIGVVSYYDLEKDSWRCFRADSIEYVDSEYQ